MRTLAARLLSVVAVVIAGSAYAAAQVQRPAITGVAFARFYAADAAASQRFYAETLGLPKLTEGAATVYPVNAQQWIEVMPLKDASLNTRMEAVGFTTRDTAKLVKYFEANHVAIAEPLKDGMFAVRDPEGVLVYFVQTGANKAVANAKRPVNAVSGRIIHVGHTVANEASEKQFYEKLLGFRPYWRGGGKDDHIDWVSDQVPDGQDWIEFMVSVKADASLKTVGVMNHVALGVDAMDPALAQLEANGCTDAAKCAAWKVARDGKAQINLYDPDLSRAELMEFAPREKPCCTEYTAKHPTAMETR